MNRITEKQYQEALSICQTYKSQIEGDIEPIRNIDSTNGYTETTEFNKFTDISGYKVNEKEMIIVALRVNGGKREKTAKQLNISSRTLYRKILKYNITTDIIYPN